MFNPFVNKKTDEPPVESPAESSVPTPPRGPGGKFMSKKRPSTDKPVKTEQQAPISKLETTFYGVKIHRYYLGGVCFYAISDILALGQTNGPLPPLEELKKNEKFNETYNRIVKNIENVDCASKDDVLELIITVNRPFPGPLARWLAETSQQTKI